MKKNGFTLIEVLIAMFVGLVIIAAVYGAMTIAQRTSANLGRKIVTQQDTRAVLDFMATEIRMASLNPQNAPETWTGSILAPNCNGLAMTQAFRGIQTANANTIAIAMDLDGLGTIGNVGNEYIVYSYDGANTITRNVSCGGNNAILGGSAPDSNVRNAAVLPTPIPLFRYFDRNNLEITNTVNNNPSLVNGIPAIRRVLITIVADTAEIDLTTKQPRRMIYSTNVIVRNHALSPP
jgi:prepilin-type N-terminal cleavage/methylation domain-containing protein